MSVRAARPARAASKQALQPPAAEQPSDASLDDMLNCVESLVQRAQNDLPQDIETACSLEASRGRVEREALCAELHSVEDECALLTRPHGVGRETWRHRRHAGPQNHSAHAAAALQGAQRAHPLIVRELERRCGALLMQAAGQRQLLAFARWSMYVRALDTTSDGARRTAELAACERAFDVQSSQANAARAKCEQLTIDNASLRRRLAAEEERSRSLVRVGQQAAARGGGGGGAAARAAGARRERRGRHRQGGVGGAGAIARQTTVPGKSLIPTTPPTLRSSRKIPPRTWRSCCSRRSRRRDRRRRPRLCSPACGATPRTSSP